MAKLYETTVINTGGRSGEVYTEDKSFEYKVAAPNLKVEGATNPEQLFAAGYSACFNSALELIMGQEKITAKSTVSATVILKSNGPADFVLEVVLEGHIDGQDTATTQALLEKAHQVCPYSKATRGNIDVTIKAI